jgi:4,5-dihydroxyphthalate decarboxylase
MSVDQITMLNVAFDDYPQTQALKRGDVKSESVAFKFSDIKPANRFFKPMVRELKFDVSEMAIGTFLQAKAYGKPLILLPATIMGRFQHGTMLYNSARGTLGPNDLAGKRVGVRAYSQTTGIWMRGILTNDYGVDVEKFRWVTQEDGHVAEYREPPGVERVGPDKDLLKMLREGELDAAVYGANLPNDPVLKSVIPDPDAAAAAW